MAVYFNRAVAHTCKLVNLQAVKEIKVAFDPFHDKVKDTRLFLYTISTQKILNTNPKCNIKVDVKSDRSDPFVTLKFVDGHVAEMKMVNLNILDMLRSVNTLCSQRTVQEVQSAMPIAGKKKGKKGKR